MTATLSHLSAEILGSILDLVDAASLTRLLLLGNTTLNNKLYGSVRRFTHTVTRTKPRALWPKILPFFHALTHVSVSRAAIPFQPKYLLVQEVDLMALPATLRSLELNFSNALLCLLETLPLPTSDHSFSPRLRSDFKRKFTHLERLIWSPDMYTWSRNWSFLEFASDLGAWPLTLESWPVNTPAISFNSAAEFPSTTGSLKIDTGGATEAPSEKLPPSLTDLQIAFRKPIELGVMANLPTNLQKLTFVIQHGQPIPETNYLSSLAQLNHLTQLNMSTLHCGVEFASLLPRTLTFVRLGKCNTLEVESLACLPPDLAHLFINFSAVSVRNVDGTTSTMDRIRAAEPSFGLPDDFMPDMRPLVSSMPRKLKSMSTGIFLLLRPRDWDAYQGKELRNLESLDSPSGAVLGPLHVPFLPHLPQNITQATITFGCPLALAAGLPSNLRRLELTLVASKMNLQAPSGSMEEFEAMRLHNTALFETLSRRTPHLKSLSLNVDPSFELEHLRLLSVPLVELTIWGTGPSNLRDAGTEPKEISLSPAAYMRSVKKLSFHAFVVSTSEISSFLRQCSEVTSLYTRGHIPADYLPHLPPKLLSLHASFKTVDASVLRALPRSLHTLNLSRNTGYGESRSLWQLQDLLLLPPKIRYACLPMPDGALDFPPQNELQEMVRGISNAFHNDVKFVFEAPERDDDLIPFQNDFCYDDSSTASLSLLTTLESLARSKCGALRL